MKHTQNRKIKRLITLFSFIVASSILCLTNCSSFGGDASGERLKRIQASPHYKDGVFVNTVPVTREEFGIGDYWDYTIDLFIHDEIRIPPSAIPIVVIPPETLKTAPPPGLRSIWLGHASVFIELDGFRLLLDPVFSEYASPFNFIGPKRFHPPPIALKDLPKIDAVMISHDHYDHLDIKTIQYLSSKGTHFIVPLGIGAHLDEWEVPNNQVTEFVWWESKKIGDLTIISTPAQHYSGRGMFDQNEKFWSSWSIIGPEHRVFYSGDTGFSDHFKKIGNQWGPFDLSIIKIGAYGPGTYWNGIHMDVEDAIQAHLDVQGSRMLPVHWATFNMAMHDWDEPIILAVKEANVKNVDLVTPHIGEIVTAGQPFLSQRWWEKVK